MGQAAFPIHMTNPHGNLWESFAIGLATSCWTSHRQGKKGGQPVALEQGTGTKVGEPEMIHGIGISLKNG